MNCAVVNKKGQHLGEKIARVVVKADRRKDFSKIFFSGDFSKALLKDEENMYHGSITLPRF